MEYTKDQKMAMSKVLLDLAFWVQEITVPRPLKDLLLQENKTPGLLDTGTDVS